MEMNMVFESIIFIKIELENTSPFHSVSKKEDILNSVLKYKQ